MISFNRLNDKGTEYRLVFANGKHIDIFLIPETTVTNKFGIIISSIQNMSRVIGSSFDEFIHCLLSDYQYCDLDEYRFNFLSENVKNIASYADIFVENNGVDYAKLSDESKRGDSSIFFDENEIKKIIKLSEALKICSLCSNTEIRLHEKYRKKIYYEFIDILTADEVIRKIRNLLELLGLQCRKTIWRYYDNLSHYSFIKVMQVFNDITNNQIIVCRYDRNPIPFFTKIFNNTAKYRIKFKKKGISYADDESQNDKDDKFLFDERKHKDLKRKAENNLLNKFEKISFSFLIDSYIHQTKKMSAKKVDILLKNRINQIKHISPFWDIIIAPIFSKATGIHHNFLRIQSPEKVAVMSFYLAYLLNPLLNNKFLYLFNLAAYYPESEIPESTTYRLNNVSHLINSTLNFSNDDLIRTVGSRITIARIVEGFVGRMRIRTVRYYNILTGQAMGGIDFNQIEVETIDYLTRFFSDNLKTEIEGLEENIRIAIN